MADRTLLIDISHYQTEVDFKLLKSKGVEAAIAKASAGAHNADRTFVQHVTGAAQAGMVVGAYHWNDPNHAAISQAENLLKVIANRPVEFVAIDVEQHWKDWNEWVRWIRGEIPKLTKIFTHDQVSESARQVAEILKSRLDMPVLIYTRKTFITDHARPMEAWINQYPIWLAEYQIYPDPAVTVTWEHFKAKYFPKVSAKPALPKNCTNWQIWQFTADRISLPGVQGSTSIDVNFFNGSVQDLYEFVGRTPLDAIRRPIDEDHDEEIIVEEVVEKKPIQLKARVQVPLLNVRRGPGTEFDVIGRLSQGEEVPIYDLSGYDVWVKIGANRWTAYNFRGENYMRFTEAPPQHKHLKAIVTTALLNVRSGPGVMHPDVGDLHEGQSVQIEDINGNNIWLKFAPGKWVAFSFQGRVHMQVLSMT